MASFTATSHQAADSRDRQGLFHSFLTYWRGFASAAFNPYRPELHYMRGPGPAWHAKHATVAGQDRG